MAGRREEAAPTFGTWKQRLTDAPESERAELVERFRGMLTVLGTPMIDEPYVHFVYYNPEAKDVRLIGEMNEWKRNGLVMTPLGDTGVFFRTMEFHGPLRVEYKFIVDGEWILDPLCSHTIDNGIGTENSYFVVGDYRQPPELEVDPTVPHGRVHEFEFESQLLSNSRRVYVYLPPEYDKDRTQLFPSLYIHDGGEYLTRARFANVLDNLRARGDIPPLVAVMVDPVNRAHEYWANEEYACFFEQEFLPYIESHYRVVLHRDGRGVMGASLGGLISFYLALSRPNLFSRVAGQSSALFLEEKKLMTLIEKLQMSLVVYCDVGTYEPRFIPAHEWFLRALEEKGARCSFQELPAGHNWTSWRAHLKDLLVSLWGNDTIAQSIDPIRKASPAKL